MNANEKREKKGLIDPEKRLGISEWSEGERSEPKRNGEILNRAAK